MELSGQADAIERFFQMAGVRSSYPAVQAKGHPTTSYAELASLTRRYAAIFAAAAAPCVLIALPRGADAYAAMLGAGLAGGFYAPLNDAAPQDKARRISGLLAPDFIVASPALAGSLCEAAPAARWVDPATLPPSEFPGPGTRHDTAYVIFTSGTTGAPKGVVIPRLALDHYAAWIGQSGSVTQDDRVAQYNNLGFDISVFDIYGALCFGATLIPLGGRGDRLLPARAIARERISVWASVPSVLSLMMTGNQLSAENLAPMRLFSFAGEPLWREQVEAVFAAAPHIVIQNGYGPTETTVTMTAIHLTPANYLDHCRTGRSVAIGIPFPGTGVYLMGGPHENEGEIVITGPQVGTGYWQDPELTGAVFKTITVNGEPVRAYFSGDWAEREGDKIFFRERVDFQVKIRGYRIELDEVAAAIRRCGWPVVCVFKHGNGLVALIEAAPDQRFDAAALRIALAGCIEPYAVPEIIAAVPQLPRNENDKIDRKLAAALYEAGFAADSMTAVLDRFL